VLYPHPRATTDHAPAVWARPALYPHPARHHQPRPRGPGAPDAQSSIHAAQHHPRGTFAPPCVPKVPPRPPPRSAWHLWCAMRRKGATHVRPRAIPDASRAVPQCRCSPAIAQPRPPERPRPTAARPGGPGAPGAISAPRAPPPSAPRRSWRARCYIRTPRATTEHAPAVLARPVLYPHPARHHGGRSAAGRARRDSARGGPGARGAPARVVRRRAVPWPARCSVTAGRPPEPHTAGARLTPCRLDAGSLRRGCGAEDRAPRCRMTGSTDHPPIQSMAAF